MTRPVISDDGTVRRYEFETRIYEVTNAPASPKGRTDEVRLTDLEGNTLALDTINLSSDFQRGNMALAVDYEGNLSENFEVKSELFFIASERPEVSIVRSEVYWHTPRTLSSLPESTQRQIAGPYVVAGAITELSAKVKVGKTTLLLEMIRSLRTGIPFFGHAVDQTDVVYLTEEGWPSIRNALSRARLDEVEGIHLLSQPGNLGLSWSSAVGAALSKCSETGALILVVDTLSQWARLRGDDENSAGRVMEVMEPLRAAAASGVAVVVLRHDRKSGGGLGDSGRGSSALAGTVDIVLHLDRADSNGHSNRRKLEAVSRFGDVPPLQYIDLTENGYVVRGERSDIESNDAMQWLLENLPPATGKPMLLKDIQDASGIARSTLQRAIEQLTGEGKIARHDERGKTKRAIGYTLAK